MKPESWIVAAVAVIVTLAFASLSSALGGRLPDGTMRGRQAGAVVYERTDAGTTDQFVNGPFVAPSGRKGKTGTIDPALPICVEAGLIVDCPDAPARLP
jgi:hypothetical protein